MTSLRSFALILMMVVSTACQTATARAPSQISHPEQIKDLPTDAITIQNPFFKTIYSKTKNIAYYSEYELTADHLRVPPVPRSNKFHPDPYLIAQGILAVTPDWYTKSGYDRGHLAPSGDFAWSTDSNYATFTMSNMTPQRPNLNRAAWESLEATVRRWACTENDVEIITGPILDEDGLPQFNGHPMPIPNRFFKVILRTASPQKAIGFIMSQNESDRSAFQHDVATIDQIEQASGLALYDDMLSPNDPVRTHADINEWTETECQPSTTNSKPAPHRARSKTRH